MQSLVRQILVCGRRLGCRIAAVCRSSPRNSSVCGRRAAPQARSSVLICGAWCVVSPATRPDLVTCSWVTSGAVCRAARGVPSRGNPTGRRRASGADATPSHKFGAIFRSNHWKRETASIPSGRRVENEISSAARAAVASDSAERSFGAHHQTSSSNHLPPFPPPRRAAGDFRYTSARADI